MTIDPAARARALVGVRFRPQGRSPALGLDCVGVALCAFGLNASEVRCNYRIRGNHRRELMNELGERLRRVARTERRRGDLLLLQVAREQLHLGIQTDNGFVHADARIGRVVESEGTPSWPLIAVFRRRARKQRQN